MDYFEVIATVAFLAGLVMIGLSARTRKSTPSEARIAAVERKLDLIMKHLGVVEPRPEFPDVVQYLMQGQKIQAIKVYRERTGTGLAEAKNAVERMAQERGLG